MSKSDLEKAAQTPSIVSSILENFVTESPTFTREIVDREGNVIDTITLRRLTTYKELKTFEAAAAEFLRYVLDSKQGKPATWKEFLPESTEEASAAFTLHWFTAEPTKIDQFNALKLIKIGNPWILNQILNAIDANQIEGIDKKAAETLTEEKNA